MSAVLLLPPGCVPAFVGEGAANVVFTLGLPDDCAEDASFFKGRAGSLDSPPALALSLSL